MKVSKQQRTIALVAGGLILAYLAYRWYAGRQTQATTTGAVSPAPDTSSSDYAALAGQEQADVAALQGQNAELLSQEQGDVAGLQGTLSGLTATVGGWTDAIGQLVTGQQTLGTDIAALATGQQKLDRSQTHKTQKGGAFYKYYVKVTGHPPPATISTTNFIYEGWKAGVSATGLKNVVHPSSKNPHVAHPNPNHNQNGHTKPSADKPKPPPAPSKSKPSGKRK